MITKGFKKTTKKRVLFVIAKSGLAYDENFVSKLA